MDTLLYCQPRNRADFDGFAGKDLFLCFVNCFVNRMRVSDRTQKLTGMPGNSVCGRNVFPGKTGEREQILTVKKSQ